MKKLVSKKINREYYIDPLRTESFEGLPCFSEEEVEIMKGMELTLEELNFLFDAKAELSVNISDWKPPKKVAANPAEKEALHPPPGTKSVYDKTKREEMVRHWSKSIREEIESRKVRTGGQ